jgi:hypothetical protein
VATRRRSKTSSWTPGKLLLGPRIRERLGEVGHGEIRRRGAIDDCRNDAGRNEGEGRQLADVPFTLRFTLRNLGEGGYSTEPDDVDPSASLVSTMSLKRSTLNIQLSTSRAADYPICRHFSS